MQKIKITTDEAREIGDAMVKINAALQTLEAARQQYIGVKIQIQEKYNLSTDAFRITNDLTIEPLE